MENDEEDKSMALAIELVDEALRGFDPLMTPELRQIVRAVMVTDPLDSVEGAALLPSVAALGCLPGGTARAW